jgi:hypothetical protein
MLHLELMSSLGIFDFKVLSNFSDSVGRAMVVKAGSKRGVALFTT